MQNFKEKKILVVDDDLLLREILSEIFSEQGAIVHQAENGSVAFKMIGQIAFDVVFSDVRMPNGDGIQLAKNISEMAGVKPMLFMCSGFNDLSKEDIENFKILKVYEKPFDRRLIVSEIAALLERRHMKV